MKRMEIDMKKLTVIVFLVATMLLAECLAFAKDDNLVVFEVSPNPMDKDCTISLAFRTPGVSTVTVNIENQLGEVVRNIYTGVNSKYMQFDWDRTSASGIVLPAGRYFVSVGYNTRYTSTKKTLILK